VSGPFFNEFLVRSPKGVRAWDALGERDGVVAGFPLGTWLPEYADGLLVCVTEVQSDAAIDRVVAAVASDAPERARAGGAR
jgi:glycine dehydrogenase subunit 1